ncbi:unnamed protein product [Paramecium pentaurelia]|uniref:Endonuclease/exonuclease/phosphatase domain-containing protein n=1 Tax=Paramecium pentaurelia TaxID=43138 RepID=A0A8S1RYE0_9CILI|nr:unnamed protein product [Paramecium pentaurelia]
MQQQITSIRKWLGSKHNNSFRLMSYNILADSLLQENEKQLQQYEWKNRWPLIFSQIKKYKPDILCLQELDCDENDLSQLLIHDKYEKLYLKRSQENQKDGCALFFLKQKFKLIKSYNLHLKQEHLFYNSKAKMDKPNICLITVLQDCNDGNPLIVANSHLIFNKNRGDLKLSQLQLIMITLQSLQLKYQNSRIVWCGDFNLTPNSALYSYISQGQQQFSKLNPKRISGQYSISYHPTDYMQDRINVQKKCGEFNIQYEQQDIDYDYDLYVQALRCQIIDDNFQFHQAQLNPYPIVETPIQFRSVYADLQKMKSKDLHDFYAKWSTYEPLITTMSSSQVGCVDYIWINKLQVSQILQMPKIEYLIENPIVNQEEGSDHLPLVCDLY